jgi:UDP-GlcNAc:undecaprenyl-phosphate GlcNAc-1-phosphate transferase
MNARVVIEIFTSFCAALALVPAVGPLSRALGFVDQPGLRRRHRVATPLLGGVAVIGAWAAGMFWFIVNANGSAALDATVLMTGALAMQLIGLADDRRGLGAGARIALEFTVAAAVVMLSPRIQAFGLPWVAAFGPGVWALLCLWIVGASNALNLIDGSDGLAGIVTLLTAAQLVILGVAWGTVDSAGGAAMICVIAPMIVFLRRNWAPAKLFLGDNGSLPLGFILAASAMMLVPGKVSFASFFGMLATLGYPILDTGLSSWRRRRVGLSVLRADRGHLHHRLERLGLSTGSIALAAGAVTLVCQAWAGAAFWLGTRATPVAEAWGCAGLLALAVTGLSWLTGRLVKEELKRTEPQARASAAVVEAIESVACSLERRVLVRISLDPLFTTALREEGERWEEVLVKVLAEIFSIAGPGARVLQQNREIHVLCAGASSPEQERSRFSERIRALQAAELIQFSTCELPIKASWKDVYEPRILEHKEAHVGGSFLTRANH